MTYANIIYNNELHLLYVIYPITLLLINFGCPHTIMHSIHPNAKFAINHNIHVEGKRMIQEFMILPASI